MEKYGIKGDLKEVAEKVIINLEKERLEMLRFAFKIIDCFALDVLNPYEEGESWEKIKSIVLNNAEPRASGEIFEEIKK